MKRGRRIAFLVLVCFGAVALVALLRGEREPVYQGKTLSQWLLTNEGLPWGAESEVGQAIAHFGTNALPWLVRWIGHEPPAWTTARTYALLTRLRMGPIRDRLYRGDPLAQTSQWAFQTLGATAAPAAPQLARMLEEPSSLDRRCRILSALVCIGPSGFPPLLKVLNGPRQQEGYSQATDGVLNLYRKGVDVGEAMPTLLLLNRSLAHRPVNPELWVRDTLAERPAVFTSALTNCLRHSDTLVRLEALDNLAWLGQRALVAVPAVRGAFDDPDAAVREAATNALRKITQEILKKENEQAEQSGR